MSDDLAQLDAWLGNWSTNIRHDRGTPTSNADVCMCAASAACPAAADRTTIDRLRAALKELEQLRTQVANFPDQLADAQEVALDKLVEAFGEGWDNCRMHLEDEGRLKRGVAVTQYSNQLPWPTYADAQQPGGRVER